MRVRLSLLTVALVFVALGASILPKPTIVRAEAVNPEVISQSGVSTGSSTESGASYNYQAQKGDSYTKMARKAVQTYGLTNSINLSGAKIVYAETHLTKDAGSPRLDLGQSVAISEASVKAWVEKAMAITAEEESAWNFYVQFVNFNTNNVGEAK
jgi:hypothetical protein